MSVILYDATKQVMFSDGRAYGGDSHPVGTKHKIYRIPSGRFQGSLIGITSDRPGQPEELVQWIAEGMGKEAYAPSEPSWSAILVKPNGEIFLFDDSYFMAGPIESDVVTIGSGKRYALGAYRAGATGSEAVRVAIDCDTMCGLPVRSVALREDAP